MTQPTMQSLNRLQSQVSELIRRIIQSGISADSRATDEDDSPSVLLSIGATVRKDGTIRFGYQTGDNSFMGDAYGHQTFATVSIYPFSSPTILAEEMVNEIDGQIAELSL
jgi:hypothetical protein